MTTPYTFDHSAYAADLQATYGHLTEGEESGVVVNVAGRVMLPVSYTHLTLPTIYSV